MTFNPKVMGKVMMSSITRELLFEDERNERLSMPYADLWMLYVLFSRGFNTGAEKYILDLS